MRDASLFLARSTFLALIVSGFAATGSSQSPAPQTRATPDGDMTIPVKTGALGQKDPAALTELAAHRAAVGGSPWIGMQGTGDITYAADSSASYPATLSNLRSDDFRLDEGTKAGPMSTRIDHFVGKTEASDGTTSVIPPETALSGLFPFEIARLDMSSAAASNVSLFDRGMSTIGNASLHRITMELPFLGQTLQMKAQRTHVIDLYFDPATHLLVKTAVLDSVTNSRRIPFLFVVTYSDYRSVGNTLVPFRFTETMEGEPLLTLQLSSATLAPTLTSKDFQF